MAGQDEALAALAMALRQQPPTADEQGSPEEWGLPGKVAAQRMAMGDMTRAGALDSELERAFRLAEALVPSSELGNQRGPGVMQIPRDWKLPAHLQSLMPIGFDQSKTQPGDLDRPVARWPDPANEADRRAFQLYRDKTSRSGATARRKP